MKTLVVIDYQNDFVASDGLLTCGPPAQEIKNNLINLINEILLENGTIIFTLDTHNELFYKDTLESEQFPIHCIASTNGHCLYGGLESFLIKYPEQVSTEYKISFSLSTKQIEKILLSDEIILCGVATNICVLQNAIGFYNISADTYGKTNFYIAENCCASFDLQSHNEAIKYMKDILGFKPYDSQS